MARPTMFFLGKTCYYSARLWAEVSNACEICDSMLSRPSDSRTGSVAVLPSHSRPSKTEYGKMQRVSRWLDAWACGYRGRSEKVFFSRSSGYVVHPVHAYLGRKESVS